MAGRLGRAQRNFLETLPAFVAAVFMVEGLDKAGLVSAVGAVLYVGGRTLFLPLYA